MRDPLTFAGLISSPRFMSDLQMPRLQRWSLAPPKINTQLSKVFIPQGQAAAFRAREDMRLSLTEGRFWITFEAPRHGLAPRNGDHFIAAGDTFDLLAGEQAVLEPVGAGPGAWFDLAPVVTLPWRAVAQQVLANLRHVLNLPARRVGAGPDLQA